MHEQTKLDEAKYFLAQLRSLVAERTKFNYNLSAFLAAARSVLQYAHKESETKTGGPAWYTGQVAGKPVVAFFRDKRNVSIHANPIKPSAIIHASVTDRLVLSDSVSVTITRKDGTVEKDDLDSEALSADSVLEALPPPEEPANVEYEYVFADWNGNEDVITLCERYVNELDAIVSDGIAGGFLTQ